MQCAARTEPLSAEVSYVRGLRDECLRQELLQPQIPRRSLTFSSSFLSPSRLVIQSILK